MLESFLAWSSLPNLHPALVHFPLALLPLAGALDVLTVVSARRKFDQAAVVLYALGAGLGWWAAEVGEDAADSFVDLPAAIEPAIAEHSDMAHYALYAFAVVVAARLVLAYRDRASERVSSRGVRLLVLLVAAIGFFFLFETAEHGGALVFRHGLAVSSDAVMFERSSETDANDGAFAQPQLETDPAARLLKGEDGSLTWMPLARDGGAIGRVLFPVTGFPRGAVEVEQIESTDPGLSLIVRDRAILVFGSEFGDARVEAELVLDDFTGVAGVAHHVQSAEAASWFEVSGTGAALRLSQGGSILTLEDSGIDALTSPVRIAVSVVDGHHKGMVNGTVVVHGHINSPDPGKVGLFFDGSGRVEVRRVSVEPVRGHNT